MKTLSKPLIFFILSVMGTGFFAAQLAHRFQNPFPTLTRTISSPLNRLSDLGGVALGMRSLTADLAWIETLQYYGAHETGQSDPDEDNGIGVYPQFLQYCERVVHIDPYFTYVYYYGAGTLAWNLKRPGEAETLLKEGIQANPTEWRLHQYLAGMTFATDHNPEKIIAFLEGFLYEKECPNLLRNILAHLYQKQHRYQDAFRVLLVIQATGDPAYAPTADREMQEVLPHLHMR